MFSQFPLWILSFHITRPPENPVCSSQAYVSSAESAIFNYINQSLLTDVCFVLQRLEKRRPGSHIVLILGEAQRPVGESFNDRNLFQ